MALSPPKPPPMMTTLCVSVPQCPASVLVCCIGIVTIQTQRRRLQGSLSSAHEGEQRSEMRARQRIADMRESRRCRSPRGPRAPSPCPACSVAEALCPCFAHHILCTRSAGGTFRSCLVAQSTGGSIAGQVQVHGCVCMAWSCCSPASPRPWPSRVGALGLALAAAAYLRSMIDFAAAPAFQFAP